MKGSLQVGAGGSERGETGGKAMVVVSRAGGGVSTERPRDRTAPPHERLPPRRTKPDAQARKQYISSRYHPDTRRDHTNAKLSVSLLAQRASFCSARGGRFLIDRV